MLVVHASRSRYEAFMKCMRLGYLQYHYQGTAPVGVGIVKAGANIYLATGSMIHKGLELICKWCATNKQNEIRQDVLEGIVATITRAYFDLVFPTDWKENGGGFDLSDEVEDEDGNIRTLTDYEMTQRQQYTFDEQSALAEALLRLYAARVLPKLLDQYRIVTVEKDMAFQLTKWEDISVVQSAKVDLALQDKANKDIVIVSYKSVRSYDKHTAKVASHDTQGLSESWAFDELLRGKGNTTTKISGVKMLYLVKGVRRETKRGNGNYEQVSPLIKGYRMLTEDGPVYAHSWYYPNPENASGQGALGRRWDKFDVFNGIGLEEVGGVKGWIQKLDMGDIQPECGDILAQQVVEPEIYLRNPHERASWLTQTINRETDIAFRVAMVARRGETEETLDELFPQNRQACHYYPGHSNDCPYLSVCHGTDEERHNPFENNYVQRTPHHEAELIQIKGATK